MGRLEGGELACGNIIATPEAAVGVDVADGLTRHEADGGFRGRANE